MARSLKIEGNVPALVTPFGVDGTLLEDDFRAHVEWHIGRGVDGICIAGDNGEAWNLGVEERRRLAALTVEAVAGRLPVIMGASATTARQSIAYCEAAAQAGVDAVMVGPQSYVMKATTAELVGRMEAIHAAVPLPVVLYNSPRRTGISLTLEALGAIADAVPVVALKEASRDFFHVTNVIRHFAHRFSVMIGPGPFIVPGLQLGAAGFISSGPELLAGSAGRLRRARHEPIDDDLRQLHFQVTEVYELLMATGTWPASLKYGLECIGQKVGIPREPVLPLEPAQRAVVSDALARINAAT